MYGNIFTAWVWWVDSPIEPTLTSIILMGDHKMLPHKPHCQECTEQVMLRQCTTHVRYTPVVGFRREIATRHGMPSRHARLWQEGDNHDQLRIPKMHGISSFEAESRSQNWLEITRGWHQYYLIRPETHCAGGQKWALEASKHWIRLFRGGTQGAVLIIRP